jgi:hypothetical protein
MKIQITKRQAVGAVALVTAVRSSEVAYVNTDLAKFEQKGKV